MAAVELQDIPHPNSLKPLDLIQNLLTIWRNFKKIRNHFPYYNVKDYGAKGNGVTNDGPAIQRAYDAAKANVTATNGGGKLYFPSGIYLSGALDFDSPFVSIEGDGPSSTELRTTGTGTSFVKFNGGSTVGAATHFNISVCDIKIAHNQSSGAWTNLVHLLNCSEINFYNVWIEGTTLYTDYALKLESALTINFDSCIMRGGKVDTARVMKKSGVGEAYPNFNTFRKCLIKTSLGWGLHYTDGEGLLISDCDMSACGDPGSPSTSCGAIYVHDCGVEVGAGLGAVIEYTRFEGTSGIHVKVGDTGFAPGGVLIFACAAGGALVGVYGDVTSPGTSRTIIQYSGFVGSSDRDYKFLNDSTAIILDCRGISATLTATSVAIPTPQDTSQSQTNAGRRAFTPGTLTNNSTTPSVANYGPVYLASNSSATSITKFLGSKDGDAITIFATNGNTELVHQATGASTADELDCPGGLNYTIPGNSAITLTRVNGRWRTTAYSTLGNRDKHLDGEYVATLTTGTSGSISIVSTFETLAYTKVGRKVFVTGRIDVDFVSSPVGTVKLSLPYPVATVTQRGSRTLGSVHIENFPGGGVFLYCSEGDSFATLMYSDSGVLTSVSAADFDGDEELTVNLQYLTD